MNFGIPYAHQNDDGSVTCPTCGERITQKERKDFESFTGQEYAMHDKVNHALERQLADRGYTLVEKINR